MSAVLVALPKYLKIYRVSLTERLVYRADFFLGTILRFLPTVTTILLWEAIYEGSKKDELGGFKRDEMIAYLLLVHVSRMFSSMPGLAYGIARDVRDGSLKKYLLQPIDMIAYLVAYRGAHKTAYIATTALPYALLFFLFRAYFPPFPDALTLTGYVVSLLLAFLIGFFFEASLGMMGFWFLEVTSLLYIVGAINFFVSGQMLPPDFLPKPWSDVLKALPFKYLAYFPAMVFLGKVRGWDLVYGLVAEVAWAACFIVLARLLYRWGLRRYSAYGG
ncbi:MAG TPA: ABC-2 family transporter protein [Gemmataceae bacterium]|nr:ABC-2 family transporter protein [Gemmataceae bacterium]